jgi:hypothetical protein
VVPEVKMMEAMALGPTEEGRAAILSRSRASSPKAKTSPNVHTGAFTPASLN